ncbi:hypothetical protein [Methylobacterium oxalidis]|uniref:hypothetical protein n=1 Tax=Methylobacterium oxalidis TaxID=944322 RepID=UPI0033155EEE
MSASTRTITHDQFNVSNETDGAYPFPDTGRISEAEEEFIENYILDNGSTGAVEVMIATTSIERSLCRLNKAINKSAFKKIHRDYALDRMTRRYILARYETLASLLDAIQRNLEASVGQFDLSKDAIRPFPITRTMRCVREHVRKTEMREAAQAADDALLEANIRHRRARQARDREPSGRARKAQM